MVASNSFFITYRIIYCKLSFSTNKHDFLFDETVDVNVCNVFALICLYPDNMTYIFSPITYAWEGGSLLANTEDYKKMAVTREQYEEYGHTICSETFDI